MFGNAGALLGGSSLSGGSFWGHFDVDGRCDKRDAGKNKVTAIANLKLKTEDFLVL